MLTLYPGNRMEELVQLMLHLMQQNDRLHALSTDLIVVQNPGMQHWLSMEMAQHNGVAMNIEFPLLSRFIWKMMRRLDPSVPDESPYAREVLVWRIYNALATLSEHPDFTAPTAYWLNDQPDALKRYQLARTQADLYEQYLIYRPDWIEQWDQGQFDGVQDAPAESVRWQAVLWHHLTQQEPRHPLYWLHQARTRLMEVTPGQIHLPDTVYVFGINTMAPVWWDFLRQLSTHMNLHIFTLNPSDEYWGDIQSPERQARQRAQWLAEQQKEDAWLAPEVGNPLLAAWGRQGQEFIRLMYATEQGEISVFSPPVQDTLLGMIQRDILHLQDATTEPQTQAVDDSIVVTNAHSALREVQGLHDWLLQQMAADPRLQPRDIVVMCPAVEDYAPYIEAVFDSHGMSSVEAHASVRLPCSIADRSLHDSLPLVQSFMALMALPDSRFSVNSVLAHLRLPAVQRRFGIDAADLPRLTQWLKAAAVHWGLDAEHKRALGLPADAHYTWHQGLQRLLFGFMWGDAEAVFDGQLLLPWVEGDQADLLGKLMHVLRVMQEESQQWMSQLTAIQWQARLVRLLERLYDPDDDERDGYDRVLMALHDLVAFTHRAGSTEHALPLAVVQDYFRQAFQQPEQRQRFMTGQVTFCSMVPMRSIPFKVIAVLGLNDGEFPRQRQPLGFDLMAHTRPRLGDRSRRGDDRYLFLEAMVSARQSLYLSYQGRSAKNNEEQQPSLVLQELLRYLSQGYGVAPNVLERQLPLQPFSLDNYRAPLFSYDAQWFALLKATEQVAPDNLPELTPLADDWPEPRQEPIEYWVRWFTNPPQAFAQERLGLYLERADDELDDTEPFVADYLARYGVQDDVIQAHVQGEDVIPVLERHQLGQHLPSNPTFDDELMAWTEEAQTFAELLCREGVQHATVTTLSWSHQNLTLQGETIRLDQQNVFWRFATCKPKDTLRLWLHHLIANCSAAITTKGYFRAQAKHGTDVADCLTFSPVADAEQQLRAWYDVWQRLTQAPSHLLAALALARYSDTEAKPDALILAWQKAAEFNPYLDVFWPAESPEWTATDDTLLQPLYQPMLAHQTYGPVPRVKADEATQ